MTFEHRLRFPTSYSRSTTTIMGYGSPHPIKPFTNEPSYRINRTVLISNARKSNSILPSCSVNLPSFIFKHIGFNRRHERQLAGERAVSGSSHRFVQAHDHVLRPILGGFHRLDDYVRHIQAKQRAFAAAALDLHAGTFRSYASCTTPLSARLPFQ